MTFKLFMFSQKPVKCPICVPVRGFINERKLAEHLNVHTGKKPFKCKQCGAAYASEGNRNAHVR